jgi:flagellar biosynthetic protein FliR
VRIQVESATLITLLLVSARILAWATFAPPLAVAGVPKPVKVVLSVAMGLAVVPVTRAHAPAPELLPVAGSLLEQVLVGAALGFVTRMVFAAVEAAGELIDMSSGFTVSAAYDPLTTTTTSVYGRFYALMTTTLIFATDAHLVILRGFLRTFTSIPLDAHLSLAKLDRVIAGGITELFISALQIAGPLIIVLFIADIALGVLNRIAPQLNAFSMSFPIKIGLTLLLVGLGFTLMPNTVAQLAGHANRLIGAVTG